MKHNWKYICRTPGYYTLKQSYIDSLNKKSRMRSKKELYKMFRRILCAAQKEAHATDERMEDVLWAWEEMRGTTWWFGYYSNQKELKQYTVPSHPMKLRGSKKHYKAMKNISPKFRANIIQRCIREDQKEKSTRPERKDRWSTARKKQQASIREYHKNL